MHARVALQACFESRLFMDPSILAAAAVAGVCRVQSGVFTRLSRPVVRFSAFLTGSQRRNFFFSPSKFFFFEGSGPGAAYFLPFPESDHTSGSSVVPRHLTYCSFPPRFFPNSQSFGKKTQKNQQTFR